MTAHPTLNLLSNVFILQIWHYPASNSLQKVNSELPFQKANCGRLSDWTMDIQIVPFGIFCPDQKFHILWWWYFGTESWEVVLDTKVLLKYTTEEWRYYWACGAFVSCTKGALDTLVFVFFSHWVAVRITTTSTTRLYLSKNDLRNRQSWWLTFKLSEAPCCLLLAACSALPSPGRTYPLGTRQVSISLKNLIKLIKIDCRPWKSPGFVLPTGSLDQLGLHSMLAWVMPAT